MHGVSLRDNLAKKLQEIVDKQFDEMYVHRIGRPLVAVLKEYEAKLLTELGMYLTNREEQIRADAFEKGREYERKQTT